MFATYELCTGGRRSPVSASVFSISKLEIIIASMLQAGGKLMHAKTTQYLDLGDCSIRQASFYGASWSHTL